MSTGTEALEMPSYPERATTDEQPADGEEERVLRMAEAERHPVWHAPRDAADVRTILSLSVAGILLVVLVLLMAGVLAYKVLSSPPVVVVDRTREGDRVVSMNGETLAGPVLVSKERPGDGDKKYAANQFAKYLYQIDPATRADDLERAIKMMVPSVAVELMKQIKPDLEQQRRERWQSVWEPQVASIDPADPYTVRVLGRQHITKIVKNERREETRQLAFNLKVVFDSQRRAERNDRTGFLIADLRDFQIITEKPGGDVAGNAAVPSGAAAQPAAEMPQPGQLDVPQP
ncbi:MAG: VirB8/TrbF family protein [Acidobacteriota bacterium]|nr:VirB8/TrbF family protein [Acidobacteriota bacterium]